jgi:hypothetical protein
MPTTQPGQVTITANGDGKYIIQDNSNPTTAPRTMCLYESLRDAQKALLSASDQARLDMGTPFSALSSVQVV